MTRFVVAVVLTTLSIGVLHAQAPPAGLAPLDALIGTWQGPQEGDPGKGTSQRTYARALNARFIEIRNRSVYPPQEKNPKGERHEDFGIFSWDNARQRIVFRQFHQEGFVNQYVMEPAVTPGTLVFVSEAIENIPSGYRARETYRVISADEIEEVFEIAEPGRDFAPYSRTRLKRVR